MEQEHINRYLHRYGRGLRENKIRIIDQHIGNIQGQFILDIGCGIGFFSNLSYRYGANVLSVDLFRKMIEHTQKSNKSLYAIRANGLKLPIANETVDMALIFDVVEHLHKPSQFFSEIHRILKPKGRLLLTTDNIRVLPTNLFLRSYRWMLTKIQKFPRTLKPLTKLINPHIREYSVDEMRNLLESSGFEISEYDTFFEVPFFKYINLPFSFFLRGPLRKYKWESQFFEAFRVG